MKNCVDINYSVRQRKINWNNSKKNFKFNMN